MKRVFLACVMLCFLCGCSSGPVGTSPTGTPTDTASESVSPSAPEQDSTPEIENTGNPNPIPALKDVTADDLGTVFWWCEELSNGGMWEVWNIEQNTEMLKALQNIQLLDEGTAADMVPELKIDIHLKNGELVSILFVGDCVDFGGSLYHYKDYSSEGYPEPVYTIFINNPAYVLSNTYEDPSDIDALMKVLKTSPCPAPEQPGEHAPGMISLTMNGPGYYYNMQYKAVPADGTSYIFKRFFTVDTCLGEIGGDAFAQLKIAEDGQFGTHRNFSVTSGGESIYPPAAFVNSFEDDSHGEGVYNEADPYIGNYVDLLQSVTLSDDFSVWIKEADKTWYKITSLDKETTEGHMLTRAAFDGLAAGTYQVEVYVMNNGNYIKNLGKYEYTTDVHFFLVMIP